MLTKLWGLRWWMIGLLMLGSIINYLTRSTLAVAAPTVLKDLHITTQQYSWILGAFQGAIMLQPLCGYVLDGVGLKIGFAIFAIAWSFISMAHGLAGSWQTLFGPARAAGLRRRLGQPGRDEGDVGMVPGARARPRRRRLQHRRVGRLDARAAARRLGDPDAQLAVRVRAHRRAWARLGGAVAAVLSVARETPGAVGRRNATTSSRARRAHLAGDGRPSFRNMLAQRNFWGIALPRFLADPTWGTLTFWLPLYLTTVRDSI